MRRLAAVLLLSLAASAMAAERSPSVTAGTDGTPSAPLAAPLTQEAFVAALTAEVAGHFSLEGDLELELLRAWAPPAVIARDWRIVISDYPSVAASSLLLRCRILADGAPVADSVVTLRAAHWRDAWVARQPLVAGATFDPAALEARRVDLFRDRDALPAVVGDNSFVYTRSVNAGRLLTWRDLARRPLVRKGDVVEVTAADGMLSVSMKGLALQNGASGDPVTVRNLESRKDFTAFVIDSNRVQVRF